MRYAIHISTDNEVEVLENLLKFETDKEFDDYYQFCSVYDNGASHSLLEITFEKHCMLQRVGNQAMLDYHLNK